MTTFLFLLLVLVAVVTGLGIWSYVICSGFEVQYEREGRDVEVEGGALNVVEMGDGHASGPPIVLIHGAGTNHKDLGVSLGERLAREHRVILVDRPGQGWSEPIARDGVHTPEGQAVAINDALGKLNVERPLVVGHDWGGAVALSYALSYPEEIAGVVAIAPASHPSPRGAGTVHRIAATPYLGWFVSRFLAPVLGRFMLEATLRRDFAPQAVPADYAEAVAYPLVLRPQAFRDNAQDIVELDAYLEDQSVYYGQIGTPLVVIVGEEDRVTAPGTHAERLAADVPGARLVVLNDVGHMPHHSSPNVIAFEVNRLAERLS